MAVVFQSDTATNTVGDTRPKLPHPMNPRARGMVLPNGKFLGRNWAFTKNALDLKNRVKLIPKKYADTSLRFSLQDESVSPGGDVQDVNVVLEGQSSPTGFLGSGSLPTVSTKSVNASPNQAGFNTKIGIAIAVIVALSFMFKKG